MVQLHTSDGIVEASRECLKLSKIISEMIQDEEGEDVVAPLPNVNKATMQKVVEYLVMHQDKPVPEIQKPLKSSDLKLVLKEYPQDEVYISELMKDQPAFFDNILAANYLDIESLLELGCAALASILKGKTPQEIRQHFGLPTPTPEEEEEIKKANQWQVFLFILFSPRTN